MIETGTVLQNRYRIDEPIGQGGMGAVYVATDERFGSTVAIKETFFSDENYGKAFEREARLLNNLRHPALPKVSDHFIENKGQFLVMEYIAGDDLSEKMAENNAAFALKDVLDWANQLLDALDFLHTQETPVIHRDIKPQNLKLTSRGQIILLDFGLAKGNPTDASHKTAGNSVFGYSRNYASLEQIQGTGTDPRSDLYALGATLYHLLTGVQPTDALTRAMTVLNGDEDPLLPADQIHGQVPESIAAVIMQAMALNANHRPTSAIAMREILSEGEKNVADNFGGVISKAPVPNLLTQSTKIFGKSGQTAFDTLPLAVATESAAIKNTRQRNEGTAVEHNGKSLLTEVNSSKLNTAGIAQTNSAAFAETGKGKNRSKRGLVVGTILGGLLAAGSVAGLYVFKPDIFRPSGNSGNTSVENNALSSETNTEVTENPSAATINANANLAESTAAKKETGGKNNVKTTASAAVAKTEREETKPPQSAQPAKNNSRNNEEMGEDDVKIQGERIETRDVVIDNGRVIYKNPNERPRIQDGRPPISIQQIEKLPPKQRRKLRRIIRNQNQKDNLQIEDFPPR